MALSGQASTQAMGTEPWCPTTTATTTLVRVPVERTKLTGSQIWHLCARAENQWDPEIFRRLKSWISRIFVVRHYESARIQLLRTPQSRHPIAAYLAAVADGQLQPSSGPLSTSRSEFYL